MQLWVCVDLLNLIGFKTGHPNNLFVIFSYKNSFIFSQLTNCRSRSMFLNVVYNSFRITVSFNPIQVFKNNLRQLFGIFSRVYSDKHRLVLLTLNRKLNRHSYQNKKQNNCYKTVED